MDQVAITYEEVPEALLSAVPEFASAYQEHLADNEVELLLHVLFGDLTRFALDADENGDTEVIRRLLGFLDLSLREGDARVRNLVQVSFVENVLPWTPTNNAFVRSWPEALRVEA